MYPISLEESSTMSQIILEFLRFAALMLVISIECFLIFFQKYNPISLLLLSLSFFLIYIFAIKPYFQNPQPIYLVDFSCLKPPSSTRAPISRFIEHATKSNIFDEASIKFMSKILHSSGQSDETHLPLALHHIPPKDSLNESIEEVEMVFFPVMDDLLTKTGLSAQDIDILVVNCSGFCPSPSLSSIIINKFNMRDDVKSFNLSGMGCSAGAVGVDLASNLMKIHKNKYAVVLSTEILSTGWYPGKEKPMLIINCLFRMGSAAILLTNKKEYKKSAKYKLFCSVRSQRAFDDKAYFSAIREEDNEGKLGVFLKTGSHYQVTAEILRQNITILGSRILPLTEKLRYGVSLFRKRLLRESGEVHVPNFMTAVQHICLPLYGRPVTREIGKRLGLGEREMEAAMMTVHRFGNQSSSALWYELAYLEAKEKVKKGDKVWQLGMGAGAKSTSLVWECIRPINGESSRGPWADCVDCYPILDLDR